MLFFLIVIFVADAVALQGQMRSEIRDAMGTTMSALSRELRIFR